MKIKVPVLPGEVGVTTINEETIEFVATEYRYDLYGLCYNIGYYTIKADDCAPKSGKIMKELEIPDLLSIGSKLEWEYAGETVSAEISRAMYYCRGIEKCQNKQASAIIPYIEYWLVDATDDVNEWFVYSSILPNDFPKLESLTEGSEINYTLDGNKFTAVVKKIRRDESCEQRPAHLSVILTCKQTQEEFLVSKCFYSDDPKSAYLF